MVSENTQLRNVQTLPHAGRTVPPLLGGGPSQPGDDKTPSLSRAGDIIMPP